MRFSQPGPSDTVVLSTLSNASSTALSNHTSGMGSIPNYAAKNGMPQTRASVPATLQPDWLNQNDVYASLSTHETLSLNPVGGAQVVHAKPAVTTTMANANIAKQLTTLTTVNLGAPRPNPTLPQGVKPHQMQITAAQPIRPAIPGAVGIRPGISIPPGMMLVRNQNGQLLMVSSNSLASSSVTSTSAALLAQTAASATTTSTLKSMAATAAVPQAMTTATGQVVAQTIVPITNTIAVKTVPVSKQTVGTNKVPNTASPSPATVPQSSRGLSQEDVVNVNKCRNFLTTLIKLASAGGQTTETINNVKKLVQNLIDDKIEPEHFTKQLQIELNSQPQPYLVPFLKRSLPLLRHTMMQQTTPSPANTAASNSQKVIALQKRQQGKMKNSVPDIRLPRVSTNPNPVQYQRLPTVPNSAAVVCRSSLAMPPPTVVLSSPRQQSQKWASPGGSGGGTFRDDDDINDVASMAGVNLSEETARILATNSDLVGAQVRSCKDSTIVNSKALARRLSAMISRHPHIKQLHPDALNYAAHAVEARVKDLIEKVSLVAFHRVANYKEDEHYEASQDVKSQLKSLLELDLLEKKRHARSEREVLMRAMKSRSKNEDPEQLRLKQKAKEMQQLEMERMQIRNADETARNAIGPRKKRLKLDAHPASSGSKDFQSSFGSTPPRPRIKRVNLKDLVFVLEREKRTDKSNILYKSYLK